MPWPTEVGRPQRSAEPDEIDRLLHALGDPTRRRIVELLSERPHSVSALAEACGITLTGIAQHLRLLEAAGLAQTSKSGRIRSCQIETAGLAAMQRWLSDRRSIWERRLDQLADLLTEEETS